MAIELNFGNCLIGAASLARKSIDVVICDPPYSDKVHAQGRRIAAKEKGRYDPAKPWAKLKEKQIDYSPLTPEKRRVFARLIGHVVKRWALVFCDVEGSADWRADLVAAGLRYVRTMVWIKPDSGPQMSGDRPQCGYETIVLCHARGAGRYRWNGGGRRGVFVYNTREAGAMAATGAIKLRDGQKPIELMLDLVSLFSNEGETIMDPTMGAATTAIACMRLGRGFVGWEEHEPTFNTAVERVAAERAGSTIEARRQGQLALLELVR